MLNKKQLSEQDICTKFITPAIVQAGWDIKMQVLEQKSFTDGKVYVRGKLTTRGKVKRADYILFHKPNIRLAVIEAKNNKHSIDAGMQQALNYADMLDVPFVFSSNGDGFLFHDKTIENGAIEKTLDLSEFPSPDELWKKYTKHKGIDNDEALKTVEQDYFFDRSGKKPRYYQQIAINRTVEAIAKGQNRILLVMATGTGKTYTAFQIIHRLWKSRAKKRILFLADRTALIDQTKNGDFKHFKDKMTVIKNRKIDKSYEIYLALYQGLTGADESADAFKHFSRDFFDLIIIDECHRGSVKEDSTWRRVLTYFNKATHIGLTATPKETKEISNSEYFGEPIYTYSLKQGINDGFLAEKKVLRIHLDIDVDGYRPEDGKKDKKGDLVEDRAYNRKDYERNLVIDERTQMVADKISDFLKSYDRFAKTIVFCSDINHAQRMRTALCNANSDLVKQNHKYVVQITGDNLEGKQELDNFIDPEQTYPVIATTSELMTTGVDAQTCKVIVLDSEIKSMTKFKQIVGRGTRINKDFNKLYFTILDFRSVTDLFADANFDGHPARVKVLGEADDIGDVIEEEEKDDSIIIDEESGEEIEIIRDPVKIPEGDSDDEKKTREKIFINGVDVSVLMIREVYFDNEGKMITTNLKDYTKAVVQGQFATLNDFLKRWKSADKKEAIIKELEEQGVKVDALQKAVNRKVDLFDLICHVAYDQPPLSRKERAEKVKKRNYFAKYESQARKVLETLLDKYADEGIMDLENIGILKVKPLTNFGSAYEIVKYFGGRDGYFAAVKALEQEIYKTGSE